MLISRFKNVPPVLKLNYLDNYFAMPTVVICGQRINNNIHISVL